MDFLIQSYGVPWNDLTTEEKTYWQRLGISEDDFATLRFLDVVNGRCWHDLTLVEMNAALKLCFSSEIWNSLCDITTKAPTGVPTTAPITYGSTLSAINIDDFSKIFESKHFFKHCFITNKKFPINSFQLILQNKISVKGISDSSRGNHSQNSEKNAFSTLTHFTQDG